MMNTPRSTNEATVMKHHVIILIGLSTLVLAGCYMGWGHHGDRPYDGYHHRGEPECRRYETVDGKRRCVDPN